MPVIRSEHHGVDVAVQEHLKGKHREHCLCFQNCALFTPDDRENNCPLANVLYTICCNFGVTTPVWECSKYQRGDGDPLLDASFT